MRFSIRFMAVLVLAISCSLWDAEARAESRLTISFEGLERMIVASVLTDGGRRYFQGGPGDDCAYAFVQDPRVSAREDRLAIRFLFAGRAGAEVAGRCVGGGGNFDVVASGFPRYDKATGQIILDEMEVEAESRVFELFALLIRSELAELLRVPFRKTIETSAQALALTMGAEVDLDDVEVGAITIDGDSLQISMDLELSIGC
jgi:hypothetical protein